MPILQVIVGIGAIGRGCEMLKTRYAQQPLTARTQNIVLLPVWCVEQWHSGTYGIETIGERSVCAVHICTNPQLSCHFDSCQMPLPTPARHHDTEQSTWNSCAALSYSHSHVHSLSLSLSLFCPAAGRNVAEWNSIRNESELTSPSVIEIRAVVNFRVYCLYANN